jgi:hypothetical protein
MSKERFEAWYISCVVKGGETEDLAKSFLSKGASGSYTDVNTRIMWQAWQAADKDSKNAEPFPDDEVAIYSRLLVADIEACKHLKLQVWWIPQVPGKAFTVDVNSIVEASKLLNTLARYDNFQYEENIKGDYSNVGGLNVFDPSDDTDSPEGSWCTWYDDETGTDDINEYVDNLIAKLKGAAANGS